MIQQKVVYNESILLLTIVCYYRQYMHYSRVVTIIIYSLIY